MPVGDLPEQMQRQITAEPGDYAFSRRNSRSYSKVLDPEAAALIREFEKPSTIAQAVARFSVSNKLDAERVLVESLPLLRSLVETGLLVAAGSPESVAVAPSVEIGSSMEGWTIVTAVQAFEDCEVYQVRSVEGLLRRDEDCKAGRRIRRSRYFAGSRNFGNGLAEFLRRGCWRPACGAGSPVLVVGVARRFRGALRVRRVPQSGDPTARGALHTIAGNIVEAYAELHERGVIHGDVNPRNAWWTRSIAVKLIDFGLARIADKCR